MSQGIRLRRWTAASFALAIAGLFSIVATAGAAAGAPAGDEPLSPILARLAAPALAPKGVAAQANAVGLPPSGPVSLLRDGHRVVVTARFEHGAVTALPALRAAGGQIVGPVSQQTVTLAVAPENLDSVAAVTGVEAVWEQREPIAYGIGEGTCEGGAVVSEGLGQLRVGEAREAFELRGLGQTVGVLSDSYNRDSGATTTASQDVASGDLTGSANPCVGQQAAVNVLAEGPGNGADEGRAMLQIVHDLAPHAQLAFATAFQSEASFAQNIERLARPASEGGAGAGVIVDDVAWFEEPFFQDGPIATAVNKVTSEGVSYLSAAGNDNLFDSEGHEIASWEASEFRDAGECPSAVGPAETHCMDFNPEAGTDDSYGITVEPKAELIVDLQWAEPWFKVETDLDAFLVDGSGNVLAEATRNNVSGGRPVELISWENESSSEPEEVGLVINRCVATCNPGASLTSKPRLKFALLENGGGVESVEYPQSSGGDVVGPTIFGHAGAASAVSVAAIPYFENSEVEAYSSRGPVTHYFGPVQGSVPAPALGSPEQLAKPDLTATDCGATTFFAQFFRFFPSESKEWHFCGTSAAAPHAAAVAALVRQAEPPLSQEQVREALTETATAVGSSTAAEAGAGLIDAFAAVSSLSPPIEGGDGPGEEEAPWNSIREEGTEPLPIEVAPDAQTPNPYTPATGSEPQPPSHAAAAPRTRLLRHPRKVVRTHRRWTRVVFRFAADQAGVSFRCRVDRGRWHRCRPRLVVHLKPGRHVVKVKAVSSAGLADPTPAVFRFRVKRVRVR